MSTKYNDETVLRFILNAINKGKKHDKTKGIDLIKSGLWDALLMFRPDEPNPLRWLYAFVANGQLYLRANKWSFIVYDPDNVSDVIKKKCIKKAATIHFKNDNMTLDGKTCKEILKDIFTFSAAACLAGGVITFIETTGQTTVSSEDEVIEIREKVETVRGMKVLSVCVSPETNTQTGNDYYVEIPNNVKPGDFLGSLDHAVRIYQIASVERSLMDYEFKKAKSLHAIAKNLLFDDPSSSDDQKAIVSPIVLGDLHADLARIKVLKDQWNVLRLAYEVKKEALQKAKEELEFASDEFRCAIHTVDTAINTVKEKFKDFPELLDLIALFAYDNALFANDK